MNHVRFSRYLLITLLLACSPAAFSTQTIDWDRLVPPLDQLQSPFTIMPPDLQTAFLSLLNIRQIKARGKGNEKIDSLERGYIARLIDGGYDPDEVLRKVSEFNRLKRANHSKLVEDLNGKQVRIAGYLLPTEFSGDKVVEFLLVPSAGACVHTPPPPLNQLVHVRWEQGFANRGLFDPVWVSGRISTGTVTESVSYRDGEREVEAGYSLAATDVTTYED